MQILHISLYIRWSLECSCLCHFSVCNISCSSAHHGTDFHLQMRIEVPETSPCNIKRWLKSWHRVSSSVTKLRGSWTEARTVVRSEAGCASTAPRWTACQAGLDSDHNTWFSTSLPTHWLTLSSVWWKSWKVGGSIPGHTLTLDKTLSLSMCSRANNFPKGSKWFHMTRTLR